MGQFQQSLISPERVVLVVGATKWCVFKRINLSRTVVQATVQERLHRMNIIIYMNTNRVYLLQVCSLVLIHDSYNNFKHSSIGTTTLTKAI